MCVACYVEHRLRDRSRENPATVVIERLLVPAENLTVLQCHTEPWHKVWPKYIMECFDGEIDRHTRVVGTISGDVATLCLITVIVIERCDRWNLAVCRYLNHGSMD